jgi:hypothetical protein
MKLKHKVMLALLSGICVTCGAFGLTACNFSGSSSSGSEDSIKAVYNKYVEQQTDSENVLTYEQWLESVLTINNGEANSTANGIKNIEYITDADGDYLKVTLDDNSEVKVDLPEGFAQTTGKSAYQLYYENEISKGTAEADILTEEQWLASLKGDVGGTGNGIKDIEYITDTDGDYLKVTLDDNSVINVDIPQKVVHQHDYSDVVTVSKPTKSEDGYGYKTCNSCGETLLVTIERDYYTINVKLPDGSPAAGVTFQINGVQGITDADGVAKIGRDGISNHMIFVNSNYSAYKLYGPSTTGSATTFDYYFTAEPTNTKEVTGSGESQVTFYTYKIDKSGYYYVTIDTINDAMAGSYVFDRPSVLFTADEDSDVYYTVTFLSDNTLFNDVSYSSGDTVKIKLAKGDSATYLLSTDYSTSPRQGQTYTCGFIVEKETTVLGKTEEESLDTKIKSATDSLTISIPTTAATDVRYIKIQRLSGVTKYKLTYNGDLTVKYNLGNYNTGFLNEGLTTITNDGVINFDSDEYFIYLQVSGSTDGVSFTLTPYYVAGEKNNPVEVTLDTPVTFTTVDETVVTNSEAYYKFTPSKDGAYVFVANEVTQLVVYDTDNSIILDVSVAAGRGVVQLSADTTYLIRAVTNTKSETLHGFTVSEATDIDYGYSTQYGNCRILELDNSNGVTATVTNAVSKMYFEFLTPDKDGVFSVQILDSDNNVIVGASVDYYIVTTYYDTYEKATEYESFYYAESLARIVVNVPEGTTAYKLVVSFRELADDVSFDVNVKNFDGTSVGEGVTIYVTDFMSDDNTAYTATTDADGVAHFNNLPENIYSINVDGINYVCVNDYGETAWQNGTFVTTYNLYVCAKIQIAVSATCDGTGVSNLGLKVLKDYNSDTGATYFNQATTQKGAATLSFLPEYFVSASGFKEMQVGTLCSYVKLVLGNYELASVKAYDAAGNEVAITYDNLYTACFLPLNVASLEIEVINKSNISFVTASTNESIPTKLALGDNYVAVTDELSYLTFTVATDGTYTISFEDLFGNAFIDGAFNGGSVTGSTTKTFAVNEAATKIADLELKAWDVVTLIFYPYSSVNFNINITKAD